jgi:hypothetical protein
MDCLFWKTLYGFLKYFSKTLQPNGSIFKGQDVLEDGTDR